MAGLGLQSERTGGCRGTAQLAERLSTPGRIHREPGARDVDEDRRSHGLGAFMTAKWPSALASLDRPLGAVEDAVRKLESSDEVDVASALAQLQAADEA